MAFDPRQVAQRATKRALADTARSDRPSPAMGGVHVAIRGQEGQDGRPEAPDSPPVDGPQRQLVTAEALLLVRDGTDFKLPPGALVTDLARDEAAGRGIRLVRPAAAPERTHAGPLKVAVGSDHGGFPMKRELLDWVRALGHQPVDFGTTGTQAVDYPDFAAAVAEAVAAGTCDVGVCIDGAGIGSAMAANKVPGIRAANCWNIASASNAREHNYANVLCLGGPKLEAPLALEILQTFLGTPYGADRHGRRVDKITRIEERYARRTETRR